MIELIERTLDEVLPALTERPRELSEAMRYAVGTGGKRIRPQICLAASIAVGGTLEDAKYPAAAIEILHNYTLVHDDLPAMDNDTIRRGEPTVWTKFGEANAILAGDALLALAYRTAARCKRNVPAIIDVLGEMGVGVVRGQVEDVAKSQVKKNDDDFIYIHKTADLFIASAKMGALAGGGSSAEVLKLEEFALNLGLAFQYEDDLLDGDGLNDRATTERLVGETTAKAIAALDGLSGNTTKLSELAKKLVGRTI